MLDNGLIYGGEEGICLTWMDAVTPDGPVTPRTGCPVEIQALWYNALCFYHKLTGDQEIAELAEKVKSSFEAEFWDEEKGYLADVVQGNEKTGPFVPIWFSPLPYLILCSAKDRMIRSWNWQSPIF